MNLEQQIKQLCQEIISCESDEEALELGRALIPLLQRRVMELQAGVDGFPNRRVY